MVAEVAAASAAASIVGSLSSAYEADKARKTAKKDAAVESAKIEAQQAAEAIKLKESRKRTALGMQRARAAGTDRIFKGGEPQSAGSGAGLSSTLG
jgi:membrane protein involved in colicin uptake